MKHLIVMTLVLCLMLPVGCSGDNSWKSEEIVGQWVSESGDNYYIIDSNGDVFEIGVNAIGEYVTGVIINEDGSYKTFNTWYKDENDQYHWLTPSVVTDEFPNGWDRIVHIIGNTMVIGDSVYEWHRIPRIKWLSRNKIYYSTYDKEENEYIDHPLNELK